MHRLSVCLLAAKSMKACGHYRVATILYLLMLMGQLCHALSSSLAKKSSFTQGGSGPIRSSRGTLGHTRRVQLNQIIIVCRNNVEMIHMWYANLFSSSLH